MTRDLRDLRDHPNAHPMVKQKKREKIREPQCECCTFAFDFKVAAATLDEGTQRTHTREPFSKATRTILNSDESRSHQQRVPEREKIRGFLCCFIFFA
jgi:hypothetical protein